jgi:O-antigen/teichoic acid export membrane protein
MTSLLVTALASVALAVLGLNAEARVLGAVCGAVAATALFLVTVPPVRPRWRPTELRHIVGFGGPASGAGLLHVAITNVDYTILAARLSATQTGFYWRAFQLGVVYQDKISGIFMRLAFPVYSRTKDLEELGRLHARAARIHAAVVVPFLAVLIVVAPTLIPFVFGEPWTPAVLPTQILAVAGMVAAILTGFAQVLLAAGYPKVLLRFNVGVLVVYAGAVFITAPHGLVAVAIAVVGVYLAELVVVYGVLFRRVLGMPIGRMATDLGPAVVGTAALLATSFPLSGLLRTLGTPVPVLVVAVAATGGLVHCAVLRAAFPAAWHDVVDLAARVAPSGLVDSVRRLGLDRARVEGTPRPQPEV